MAVLFWLDVIAKATPLTGRHRMLIVLGGGRSLGHIPSKPKEASPSPLYFRLFLSLIVLGILLSYTKLGLHSNSFPEGSFVKDCIRVDGDWGTKDRQVWWQTGWIRTTAQSPSSWSCPCLLSDTFLTRMESGRYVICCDRSSVEPQSCDLGPRSSNFRKVTGGLTWKTSPWEKHKSQLQIHIDR